MNLLSEQAKASRASILEAAEGLFAEKGFDGTRVNEIAERAGVNKALIYYYFKSKADILQSLLDALVQDMKREALQAIRGDALSMFADGKVKFADLSQGVADRYLELALREMIAFCLQRQRVFRILVGESLKKGGQSSLLFRIIDLMNDDSMVAVFKEKGIQLQIDKGIMVERFFVGLLPLIGLVIYFDEWKETYKMTDEELKSAFIQYYKPTYQQALRIALR